MSEWQAVDRYFGHPVVDVDEWREEPVRHRYLHGGFTGTDTRFSFYLPPPDQYSGRFLQHIEGGNGGHENTAMGPLGSLGGIAFAISCGAYLVESNQGHFADDLSILRTEPTVAAYRASVISARYSRHLAAEMYGHPPEHGYVFGGSGGSPRTILCLEKAPDVYDGAIPYIMGHVTSWSLGFSVQANATKGAWCEDLLGHRRDGAGGDREPLHGSDLWTARRSCTVVSVRSASRCRGLDSHVRLSRDFRFTRIRADGVRS